MYCQSCWRKWNNGEGFDGLLKEGWKITDDDDDEEEETDPYKAAFDKFDTDGSGEVDFNEFIGVCCTYCMYSKQELLRFTFDSFDDDDGGTLDEEEFMILCKAVNNMNPTFPGNFTKMKAI